MAEPDGLPPAPSSIRHRTRRPRVRQIPVGLSEWRVELFVVLLVVLAVFLLVERMQIRETLFGWLRLGLQALRGLGGGILWGVLGLVRNTTLSDLTGYVLLSIASVLVIWRARWRLMRMPRFTARECPQCGSELHRVHRRPIDRLVGLAVPVARYRCRNQDCHWRGLRVKRARHE